MKVTFTVTGSNAEELGVKAIDELRRMNGVPDGEAWQPLSCEIHASPVAQRDDGTVALWEGDVEAEV